MVITLHGIPAGSASDLQQQSAQEGRRKRPLAFIQIAVDGMQTCSHLPCSPVQVLCPPSGSKQAGQAGESSPLPPFTLPLMAPWTSTS